MAKRPVNAGSDSAAADHAYARDPPERRPQDPAEQAAGVRALPWLPYLIVLAGAVTGLFFAWRGSRHAGLGTALVGVALLAAAVARLLLPSRYAGPLSSRRKVTDVAGFAVFGAAVLALALMLPLPGKGTRENHGQDQGSEPRRRTRR